jgi:hypothetical protein
MKRQPGTTPAERYNLPAAELLEPLQQGDKTGLCGLYAIINGLRLVLEPMRPLRPHELRTLFTSGVMFLEAEEALAEAMCAGIDTKLWRRLGKHLTAQAGELSGLHIVQQRPFAGTAKLDDSEVLLRLERRLLVGQPVLAEVLGPLNHYTIIAGYSAANLLLFDSYGYRRLSKTACTFGGRGVWRRHRLNPRSWLVPVVAGAGAANFSE